MTKLKIMTGIDPRTKQPLYAFVHPFLYGADAARTCVPDTFKAKSGREVPCLRCVDKGAFKPAAKQFGKREQERAERRSN